MWSARFAAGLGAVVLGHLVMSALMPRFESAVDLFVVLVVLGAASGGERRGMLGGAAAGIVHDLLESGLIGLQGFASTLVGFGAARAARQLASHEPGVIALLALGAQPLQEVVVTLLQQLLEPQAQPPDLLWAVVRTATTALLCYVLPTVGRRVARRLTSWRRRPGRIKID